MLQILEIINAKKMILKLEKFPLLNKSADFDPIVYENPAIVDKVRKIYKIDFELFNYSMDVEKIDVTERGNDK